MMSPDAEPVRGSNPRVVRPAADRGDIVSDQDTADPDGSRLDELNYDDCMSRLATDKWVTWP